MNVKICGITSLHDAQMAVDMGAYALGFNFYPQSSRYIDPVIATSIIAAFSNIVVTVGIFVNASLEDVLAIQKQTGIQMVQLHGDESIAFCQQIPVPVIKAVRPHTMDELHGISGMDVHITLLIDSPCTDHYGGTGELAVWTIAKKLALKRDIILAGGLNASNVAIAVMDVKPFMVDVCSGVEQKPGEKSRENMQAFFDALGKRGELK